MLVVTGEPGTGKTVLCSQIAFSFAGRGMPVIVATVTSEPHEKLVAALRHFSFFDQARLGENISFVSAYPWLKKGAKEAREMLFAAIRERGAKLLFIDGARAIRDLLWHRGSDAELVADAHGQSRVTHGHPRAQACCALYCLWARRTLDGSVDAWTEAVVILRRIYATNAEALRELEESICPEDEPVATGSGYVVDCLQSARMLQRAGSYEAVVKAAVRLGNDTDTTACVAGGIAGARDGLHAIPYRWRASLRGRSLYEPLLETLKLRSFVRR